MEQRPTYRARFALDITLNLMNTPRLTLKVTLREAYGENDELEVHVEVAGTKLSGASSVFDDHRQLGWLCDAFEGFPRAQGDTASFGMGIFSQLAIRVGTDAKGRLEVHVAIAVPTGRIEAAKEELTVGFLCDPAALDSFCQSIRSFHPGVECEATLQGRGLE
jgi:hypothetical protein